MPGSALVVGAGQGTGLGAHLAWRFAREGWRTVIAGRSALALQAMAAAIAAGGGQARAVVADATCPEDVDRMLDLADARGDLGLVVLNLGAARAQGCPADEPLESSWRLGVLAGLLVAQRAMRTWLPRGGGTLLFTSTTAPAALPASSGSCQGCALRAVASGLAREFGPQGVHVAHLLAQGAAGHDGAPQHHEALARACLALHREPPEAWTHELALGAPAAAGAGRAAGRSWGQRFSA